MEDGYFPEYYHDYEALIREQARLKFKVKKVDLPNFDDLVDCSDYLSVSKVEEPDAKSDVE